MRGVMFESWSERSRNEG